MWLIFDKSCLLFIIFAFTAADFLCVCVPLQIGFFDDKVGPVTVALVVEIALLIIMFSALIDVFFH
jgi:hypothetical protein